MTGDAELDRLIEGLPQVPVCSYCGILSPFGRIARYKADDSETWLCFYCTPPTPRELCNRDLPIPECVAQKKLRQMERIRIIEGTQERNRPWW